MNVFILLVSLFFLIPTIALAQVKQIPVAVSHSGKDNVGQGIAFALKEAIRASQAFRFVDHESTPKMPRVVVHLVSMSNQDNKNDSSSIGIAVVFDSRDTPVSGIYITVGVQNCGSKNIESCARQILPTIDSSLERLRTEWPDLWKRLRD